MERDLSGITTLVMAMNTDIMCKVGLGKDLRFAMLPRRLRSQKRLVQGRKIQKPEIPLLGIEVSEPSEVRDSYMELRRI